MVCHYSLIVYHRQYAELVLDIRLQGTPLGPVGFDIALKSGEFVLRGDLV